MTSKPDRGQELASHRIGCEAKRRRILAIMAACVMCFFLFPKESFTQPVGQDHGTYYRLKVKLTYKGEPQDFDIVVGCNVLQINYKDGSNTYEVGLVPTVFGRRMSDGEGLVVRPPVACKGETTANGKVQPDLLPVVVVYDDADTLDFGVAYLSEDAYENSQSVLKFGGATIEKATRAEFDAFRRTQSNLVTPESYHSAVDSDAELKRLNFTRRTHSFGRLCNAYKRFRVPEAALALVRKYWPNEKPNYWLPATQGAEHELREAIASSGPIQSDSTADAARSWDAFRNIGGADRGLMTRTGGGLVSPRRVDFYPPAFYPATNDFIAHWWPRDWTQWSKFVAAKDVFSTSTLSFDGGKMRGFAYCGTGVLPSLEQKQAFDSARAKPKVFRVDGQTVMSKRPVAAAGDTWIFERDESVFINLWIYLESTRGDV